MKYWYNKEYNRIYKEVHNETLSASSIFVLPSDETEWKYYCGRHAFWITESTIELEAESEPEILNTINKILLVQKLVK